MANPFPIRTKVLTFDEARRIAVNVIPENTRFKRERDPKTKVAWSAFKHSVLTDKGWAILNKPIEFSGKMTPTKTRQWLKGQLSQAGSVARNKAISEGMDWILGLGSGVSS